MRYGVQSPEKIIAGILRWGSGISFVFMVAGLGLFLLKGGPDKLQGGSLSDLPSLLAGAVRLEPAVLLTLGIIVLLFTPVLGVLAAGISFLVLERDYRYALVSLGVLAILALSFFVPGLN